MKRGAALTLVVILMIAMLMVGCSNNNASEPAESAASTEDVTVSEEATEDAEEPAEAGEKKYTLGVSFNTLQEERWLRELDFMEAELEAYPEFELIYQAADSDANKQYAQCENMISQGIDGLILVSQDAGVGTQIVNYAKENGVPVLAYDIQALDCDVDYYASFSLVVAGETMAQYAVDKVPSGNYYLLDGDQTHTNAQLCYEGKMNILQPYVDSGDITILGQQWCAGWTAESGLENMENALAQFGDQIDVVVASNDGIATGASQAISAMGLSDKILLTGQDGELAACQRIVEGTQAMTVYKPGFELAKVGIEVAVKMVLGEDVETDTFMNNGFKDVPAIVPKVYAVDKDNMMDTIIADEWHPFEDVYQNVPEDQRPAQ